MLHQLHSYSLNQKRSSVRMVAKLRSFTRSHLLLRFVPSGGLSQDAMQVPNILTSWHFPNYEYRSCCCCQCFGRHTSINTLEVWFKLRILCLREYFTGYELDFTVYYFGVRARALIGFVGNFSALLSSQLISVFLDYKGFSVKKRINIG
jgi:hypothetical protein